jgi:hypothetical protein
MTTEELLKPRYKVIADWPGVAGKVIVGDVLVLDDMDNANVFWCGGEAFQEDKLLDYPYLFKKLEWWEGRTIDDLAGVLFVKVMIYRGYWRVGDVVPARLKLDDLKPIGYLLKYSHFQPVYELLPATKEEYEALTSKTTNQP